MSTLNRSTLLALAAGFTAVQAIHAQEPAPQPPSTQARTHTVVRGDNLWDLSQTYLGNPFLWPEIYRLNRDVVEDPHWIYPGEILRLPGDTVPVVSQLPETTVPGPVTEPVREGAPVDPAAPTIFSRQRPTTVAQLPASVGDELGIVGMTPRPTVRAGEVLVAPYVDREGGPRGHGRIVKSADLTGVGGSSDRMAFQPYDKVLIAPPVGYVAPEGERYLSYRLGPMLENQGQLIIPTGVLEVHASARSETGAVAKVVRVFNEIRSTDRLIPIDTVGMGSTTRPVAVTDGPSAKITWIYGEPVLPSIQNFVVLNVSSTQGVRMGDEFMIFQPSRKPEEGEPREKETLVAKAQVVRATPYGVTALIIGQEQPAIKEGMSARISARMP
jgi:hypothetical protein